MSTQPIYLPDAIRRVQLKHARHLPADLHMAINRWTPQSLLGGTVKRALAHLPADLAAELLDAIKSSVVMESALSMIVLRQRDSRFWRGDAVEDYGVVGRKVVTTVGVGFIVDAWQNIVELEIMKFHGLGTGSTAEASGDTALVTELTTEYTGNVRATGTTAEGASGNIFSTVATNTLDSGTPALREHGVFSASSSGVLFDRTVFAAINLDGTVGDGLTTTYQVTLSAGG